MKNSTKQSINRNNLFDMKKVLMMFAVLTAFLTLSANAQKNDFSVKSGDSKILLQQTTACVEFDYSNTMVGEYDDGVFKNEKTLEDYLKGRGDDFVRDWPQNHEYAEKYFTVQFEKKITKKKGGMALVDANANPAYKILFHVDKLDMGNVAAGIIGFGKAGGTIFVGSVEIINLKTGVADCVFEGLVKALSHPSETVRLGLNYLTVMQEMKSLADKGVSNGGSVAAQSSDSKPTAPQKTDEPKKDSKPAEKQNAAPAASDNSNTIDVVNTVSPKLKFEDNMVIKNGTKIFINKVSIIRNGEEVASAQYLAKGDEAKIKKFSESELKSFKGETLTVRIECEQAVRQGIKFYVEYDDDDDDFIIEIKAPKK